MSSSRTLSRKFRTIFICIKPRFDPSIILLYIAASVEQYCDITQVNALPENEGILEDAARIHIATFNSSDGEDYNRENCAIARGLFQSQPGVTVRYWCEKGHYR